MFLFALYYLSLASYVLSTKAQMEITTSEGVVIGQLDEQKGYYTFYGIPYASSPTDNRFKAPLPPRQYEKFIANDTTTRCAQLTSEGPVGIEDCLTLNIFTKNETTQNPVLIWLEGEEFAHATNTATYSYKSLVGSDVVVVTVNYRLSIFGFLCLGVEEAPGNAGLKDVIAALKWVNRNIAAFGGDPKNVLILGFLTGAVMVDLISMSSNTKDLFHKAIAFSGSSLSPYSIDFSPFVHAQHVADKLNLNYTSMDRQILANALQAESKEKLLETIKNGDFTNKTFLFAPCIDTCQADSVLKELPINSLRSGDYNDILYIAGLVVYEGTIRSNLTYNEMWMERMNDHYGDFIPADLDFKDGNTRNSTSLLIRKQYFSIGDNITVNLNNFYEYENDVSVMIPTIKNIRERSKTSKVEVRLLEFNPSEDIINDAPFRAGHELFAKYILDTDSVKAHVISDILRNRIVGFAKTGNPVSENNIPFGKFPWAPFKNESYFLYIYEEGDRSGEFTDKEPRAQQLSFWDNLYSKYYRQCRESCLLCNNDSNISNETQPPNVLPSASTRRSHVWLYVILCILIIIIILLCYIYRTKVNIYYKIFKSFLRARLSQLTS